MKEARAELFKILKMTIFNIKDSMHLKSKMVFYVIRVRIITTIAITLG